MVPKVVFTSAINQKSLILVLARVCMWIFFTFSIFSLHIRRSIVFFLLIYLLPTAVNFSDKKKRPELLLGATRANKPESAIEKWRSSEWFIFSLFQRHYKKQFLYVYEIYIKIYKFDLNTNRLFCIQFGKSHCFSRQYDASRDWQYNKRFQH